MEIVAVVARTLVVRVVLIVVLVFAILAFYHGTIFVFIYMNTRCAVIIVVIDGRKLGVAARCTEQQKRHGKGRQKPVFL